MITNEHVIVYLYIKHVTTIFFISFDNSDSNENKKALEVMAGCFWS